LKQAGVEVTSLEKRRLTLKGISHPVDARVIRVP
jgi:hypothetical protein